MDPDGDGRTNEEEYILGTNPTGADAARFPLAIDFEAPGQLQFSFPWKPARSGVRYRLQVSTDGGARWDNRTGRMTGGPPQELRWGQRKETGNFDGTGLSPAESGATPPNPFTIGTSVSKDFIGDSYLGGSTSFHLNFDVAEEVSVIGFALLNYNNFQSFQRANSDYPNIHARVIWSDGVTDITQQSVPFSQQSSGGDVYFGFQQPGDGYFVDELSFYTIGNNARAVVGAAEIGIALGDGAAVPEPQTAALAAGLIVLAGVWLRRRRR